MRKRVDHLHNNLIIIIRMISYNLKIIFANRFLWFLAGAFAFYVAISLIYLFSSDILRAEELYGIFIFSGLLLVFYPTVFGIQNDQDARTIEILFGIPNYRYKVWLVRLALIYVITFLVLLIFVALSSFLITKIPLLPMTYQALFPVFFIGTFSFMISTVVKNGNGTAVTVIIFSLFFLIMLDLLKKSIWNVFLNPFNIPDDVTETAWSGIVTDNRIILVVAIVLFLLVGLYNLQKREKFI